jgi:tetratricopeptide (TPR) repeat protein
MPTLVSQTLTQSGEKLASNRAQSAPDYLSPYSDRARPIEGKFQFIRIARLAILLVCLFGTPSARSAGQVSADLFETRLAEGIKLLGEGRFLESVEVLNSAKQSAPQDARAYFYCGMALAQAGRLRDAASEVGEAVHLVPEQLHYRVFQAHVLEQLKQAAAAQELLSTFKDEQTLARLDPGWLRLLADVYYRLQMTDQALQILDLWAKHDPTDARIDLYRGQVYVVKAQPDIALSCFRRSLEKSSENPQASFEMGKILYERNQLPLAKEALLSAVREDANNPEYLAKLGSVYLAMGDADAAIECLKGVETTSLSVPTVYYTLARAYRNKGDTARSAAYMENFQRATSAERDREARKLEVERPIAQAQRELDRGNSQAARVLFEKALQVDPSQWEPHAYIAEMDLNSGDMQRAYPHLQKLEQIDADSATGNFLIARYWFMKMDYDRARLYAERVKLSRPANSEVRALLGEIYEKLGEKYKARQEYEEAVHLAPERADLRQRLLHVGGKPQSQ